MKVFFLILVSLVPFLSFWSFTQVRQTLVDEWVITKQEARTLKKQTLLLDKCLPYFVHTTWINNTWSFFITTTKCITWEQADFLYLHEIAHYMYYQKNMREFEDMWETRRYTENNKLEYDADQFAYKYINICNRTRCFNRKK